MLSTAEFVASEPGPVPEEVGNAGEPPGINEGTIVFPPMPSLDARDKMLDDIDSTAVTGHTVVNSSMVSVIRTFFIPSGSLVREAVMFLPGQCVIVGAQLIAVRVEVAKTVSVVNASPADGV